VLLLHNYSLFIAIESYCFKEEAHYEVQIPISSVVV